MRNLKIPASAPESFFWGNRNNQLRLALFATLLVTLAVYWMGLGGPLIFDDFHNLAPLTDWLQGRTGWVSVVFGNHSGALGRPVSMASFVLNIKLFGPNIQGLKLGNVVIHLVNGVLVFLLFQNLLRQGALTRHPPRSAHWLPWLGASIWLLHPLLVSTVLYVVQRMAMLSALFTLLAMLAYLHGRVALIKGHGRTALTLLAVVVPILTLASTLSKENGILAPALCAVIEWCVFLPRAGTRRSPSSKAFIILALVLPALIAAALTLAQSHFILDGYANREFNLPERLLTQPRVLWNYLGSLLLPHGAWLGLYHDDYLVSSSIFVPLTTATALLAWACTIAAAWYLRRSVPGFITGLGIFLVGHALESTVFPLLIYFEHRNYFPTIGAIWAMLSLAAFGAAYLGPRMHNPSRIFAFASAGFVIALALATTVQTSAWATQRTILTQGFRYHPNSRWLRLDLIAQAMQQDPPLVEEARIHSNYLFASTDPSTRRLGALSRLFVDCSAGLPAQPAYKHAAFSGSPEPLEADLLRVFESLSDGLATKSCEGLQPLEMADSMAAMLARSSLPPGTQGIWRLRFKTASLYAVAGRNDDALHQAQLALDGGTSDPQVAVFVADLYVNRGNNNEALKLLNTAASQIAKDDVMGHQIIGAYRDRISSMSRKSTN